MATLLLTSAVAASSLSGFSQFAATLAASTVGRFIDSKLFPQNFEQEGPRLEQMTLSTATEGTPIKRLFATSRLGGNIIWITNFREEKNVTSEKVGGKGGGGSTVTTTEYLYYVSIAFAFCEGNKRATLGRIWADSRLFETSELVYRFYPGSETQNTDTKIVSTEGSTFVSAHKGIAYVVFEDLPLADFGNRIPQITAEINVPIDDDDAEIMENLVESINLIPATGEQAYATSPSQTEVGGEVSFSNTNLSADKTDFVWAIENLKAQMPNVTSLNLVVSWFGTDLRLSDCEIVPKAEYSYTPGTSQALAGGLVGFLNPLVLGLFNFTESTSDMWTVNGVTRSTAEIVSTDADDNPNFGGVPADWSITEAIQYLLDTAELDVYYYPFILMDIEEGNTLPNTDGVSTGQPTFPWRGRITTSTPAIDGTATAETEMDSFFGSVAASDFSASGTRIIYSGSSSDFGYRRMVLHYAHLCAAAAASATNSSKFKTFYIGTEMVGVNRVRNNLGEYVGVERFITLLEDVRGVFDSYGLTDVELSYAADWSEYHSHQPNDGTGDINFPLDDLWAHDDLDHIAIDNYLPLSDWRDGTDHEDYGEGNDSYGNPKGLFIYDQDYLKGQIEGGEYYDYFYADSTARDNQTRTAIADLRHNEDWVYRIKDIRSWWSEPHYARPGGVRDSLADLGPNPQTWSSTSGATFSNESFNYFDFGDAVRIESAGQNADRARVHSGLIDNTGGKRFIFRAWVGEGTSGEVRLLIGHASGSPNLIYNFGTEVITINERTSTFNSSAVTDLGGGVFEIVIDVTMDPADTSVTFSVGPLSTVVGEDVIAYGAEIHEFGVSTTGWVPGSKRIRFSEYGVPCVDKGSNQPNVFYDPKSSESFLPYHSDGRRDDQIQRSYYEAMITYWRDNSPTSPIRMIDTEDMCAWTWDARPYPAYPYSSDIWSDTANWNLGHWINGRAGAVPLAELVKIICGWVGFTDADLDVDELVGKNSIVRGYVIDNQSSPRSALKPLFSAYLFDGFESQGKLKFILREYTTFEEITTDDMIIQSGKPSGYEITRAQETEMPQNSSVSYINPADDYQVRSTGGTRQTTTSLSSIELRYPIVFETAAAKALAEILIQEAWAARENIEFGLSPEHIKFDPGDGVSINIGNRTQYFRLSGMSKGSFLEMEAQGIDINIYDAFVSNTGINTTTTVTTVGSSTLHFMDVPLLTGDEPRPWASRIVAYQNPFPGSVNLYESTNGGADLDLNLGVFIPTQMGILASNLPAGPHTIIDEGNTLQVDLLANTYQPLSETEAAVRNGANAIAIKTTNDEWEIIKFIDSSFVGGQRYNLTRLFRGQLGTYPIIQDPIPAGQPVVFLNDPSSVYVLQVTEERKFDEIDWRYGPSAYPTGSTSYKDVPHTGQAVGQLPYPVADVQFFKTGASDVKITWKRQTRFGGEGFESETVPLNEDEERYEIDLLTSGDVLITTVSVTSSEYDYSSAPANFKARIYQMSNSVGRGRPVTKQSPF